MVVLRARLCVCVCNQHNTKANYSKTSNLVFFICITCRCNLKLFIKIGQKLCVQGTQKYSNTLRPKTGFSCKWIFVYLDYAKYNEIHIYFCYGQKKVNYRIRNNCLHDVLTGQHNIIRIFEWQWLEIVEALFSVILWNF